MRGGKPSPTYRSWCAIKGRVLDPNHRAYPDYGGKGVKLLWKSFEEFIADVGIRPEGKVIGRPLDAGDYGPGLGAMDESSRATRGEIKEE